jgi:glucosamine kinase
LLRAAFARFDCDPHAIVRWMNTARPRDFASLAPLVVEHLLRGDAVASELMARAAAHIDIIAARLAQLGAPCVAPMGGLAAQLTPFLCRPLGDALSGALRLAHLRAEQQATT